VEKMRVVFFLFLLCVSIDAFRFIGAPFPAISKVGDILTQTQKVTAVCEQLDLGTTVVRFVQGANGTSIPVYISCPTIDLIGTMDIVGYVPVDGRLFAQRSCEWRDPDSANTTDADLKLQQGVISGSSLQYVAHSPPLIQNIWLSDYQRLHAMQARARMRGPGGGGSKHFSTQGLFDSIVCSIPTIVTNTICGHNVNARLDELEKGLDQVRDTVKDVSSKLAAQQAAMEATNRQTLRTLTDVSILANNTFLIAQGNTAAIQKQGLAIEASKNGTELLASALTQETNDIHLQLVTQGNAITQLSTIIAGITDANTRNAQLQQNNITLQFNQQMALLTSNLTNQKLITERQFSAILVAFQKMKGILEATIYRTFKRRQLSLLSQQVIQDVNTGGVYRIFIDDVGLPANPNSPFAYRALVDQISIKSATGSGTPITRVHTLSVYCSTAYALEQNFAFLTFETFLKAMGPTGCVGAANASVSCLCWASLTQTSCTSSTTKIGKSEWISSGLLNTSTDCVGSTTTTPVVTYTNPTMLMQGLLSICQLGVFAGTNYIVTGLQTRLTQNATYSSSFCTSYLNVAKAFQIGGPVPLLPDVIKTMVLNGFGILRSNIYEYERIIYGEMPNNMTFVDIPFVRRGQQLGSCLYTFMMAYTTARVPITRINLENSFRFQVSIRVPGSPTANISAQQADVPASFHLSDYFVTIGNPVDGSQQYDIPTSELPLVEVASGRPGKVTYAISPNNTDTLTQWNKRNGVDFDHLAGNNVASFYAVSLDVNGKCVGQRRAGTGSWCSLRDKFKIYSAGTGLVGFRPLHDASVTFTMDIPEGQIFDIISSKCPAFNVETTSAQGVTLVLVNPFVSENTNTIIINGACGVTYSHVVTPAQGSKRIWVPACKPVFQEATIFKINTDLSLSVCTQNISVATNRATYLTVQSNADVKLVNDSSTDSIDRVALFLISFQAEQAKMQANKIAADLITFANNGIQVPPDAVALYNAANAANNNSMTDLIAQIASYRQRVPTDYTNITSTYFQRIDQLVASSRANTDASVRIAHENVQVVGNIKVGLGNLTEDVEREANTSRALVKSFAAFASALSSLTTETNGFGAGEIFEGLGEVFRGVANAGADLANGLKNAAVDLYNGIKQVVTDVYGAAKQLIDDALGLAKGLLSGIGGFIFYIIVIVVGFVALGGTGGVIALYRKIKQHGEDIDELKKRVGQLEMMTGANRYGTPVMYNPTAPAFPAPGASYTPLVPTPASTLPQPPAPATRPAVSPLQIPI
jgi:hypothetical protein